MPHKENQAENFRKSKKKHLDDLSTFRIGGCHLAGNYLPIRVVDGPAKKKGWQSKIRPSHRDRERQKKYEEEIKGEVQGKS